MIKKCVRCGGLGHVFKVGGGYVKTEMTGGKKIDCPMCAGSGETTDFKVKNKTDKDKHKEVA